MQPSIFISHGAPDRLLGDSDAKKFLVKLGRTLKRPKAIVIISAHWLTDDIKITRPGELETIHDMWGFPPELKQYTYDGVVSEHVYNLVSETLDNTSIKFEGVLRGLDHGAWSVLNPMYPNSEVPVLQMSLPKLAKLENYLTLGQAIRPLLKNDILIIGSGSATHNLKKLSLTNVAPAWSVDFVSWLQKHTLAGEFEALTHVYEHAPGGYTAHPTIEHYLPLLVAAGAHSGGSIDLIHDSYEYGSLNNSCFQFN